MSKTATREVEYFDDNGQIVKTVTDAATARAIGRYKNVYNTIQSFDVALVNNMPSKYESQGFAREVIVAQSHRLKIVCIKDFIPNISELIVNPRYECGILNKKTNEFERVDGGVELLYYKLFRGHTK